jgi:hypothetical protein
MNRYYIMKRMEEGDLHLGTSFLLGNKVLNCLKVLQTSHLIVWRQYHYNGMQKLSARRAEQERKKRNMNAYTKLIYLEELENEFSGIL